MIARYLQDHTCTILTAFLSLALLVMPAAFCSAGDIVKPRETSESPSNGYVGKPVAAFEAISTTESVLLSTNNGAKVLIIDLWGLNCASCLEEMKALEPIYQEFKDRGLKIWAVNTEDIDSQEIEQGLQAKGLDISFDMIVDPELKITKLFTSWFIPVTIIVDSDGIVQYYKVGFNEVDAEKIRAKVGALLAP